MGEGRFQGSRRKILGCPGVRFAVLINEINGGAQGVICCRNCGRVLVEGAARGRSSAKTVGGAALVGAFVGVWLGVGVGALGGWQ